MLRKHKKLLLLLLIVVVLLAIGYMISRIINIEKVTETSVRVLDYDHSVCTTDIPSSSCSAYKVSVELGDGTKTSYVVPGFDNAESEQYDKIYFKISNAKEYGTNVILVVDDSGQVVSAR